MRKLLLFSCFAPSLAALGGCASTSSFVHSDATLRRVVVYRNGIAYFGSATRASSRRELRLAVPADKVDDFLKSLTVVDAKTGEPAPIAYPTTSPNSETGLIDMKISLTGPTSHDLRLSYVTEAPSWKPSYRLVLGKDGKVNVQAWAVVDNTSGEDWQNVQLGVGSSSALSFRFDLRSVRVVQRETLRQDDPFAQAPPTGGAAYNQLVNNPAAAAPGQPAKRLVLDVSDEALAADASKQETQSEARRYAFKGAAAPVPPPPPPPRSAVIVSSKSRGDSGGGAHAAVKAPMPAPATPQAGQLQLEITARTMQASNKNAGSSRGTPIATTATSRRRRSSGPTARASS